MRPSNMQHDLLALALRYHLTTRADAFGRCFAATLGLADLASRHGMPVELVRWQVAGDRDFCDHWALSCGAGKVIDLTRVQVDGNTELLHDEADYPANYCCLQRYPASLLLPLFERLNITRQNRLPFWFMWDSSMSLARHDIRTAWHGRQWRALSRGVAGAAKFAWRAVLGNLHYHLIREPRSRIGPSAG